METAVRLARTWRILQALAGGPLKRFFRYTCELASPGTEPYLVVANHNTDLDPALVALSFPKKFMYFVASEHVFRKGLASRLLRYLFAPISRMKGSTDATAAMDIIRTLRKGSCVCLFAEGRRSFNGLTSPIFPATGKLAKASGAALVTYKLEGGYLTSPRWSHTIRKGRMLGYCVNVYTPEQLKSMQPDEVNRAIADDLYEDAFLREAAEPVAYKGKRLAEGLENALYICPACGRIGTLQSRDDRFFCTCGMETRYTEFGGFAGDKPFANVRDWDRWQDGEMEKLSASLSDAPAFLDERMRLVRIGDGHRTETVAEGTLSANRVGLTLGDRAFAFHEITSMEQVGSSKLVFTADGAHYEIQSQTPYYCGRKYAKLYQLIKR